MSGFMKRSTKTVNPAGGVNPASSPNVGQYGWTSYDAANVNQLIQYVNMAQAAATIAQESADFVKNQMADVVKFIEYVEAAYEQLKPVLDNLTDLYEDVVQKHKEVTSMHTDVRTWSVLAIAASEKAKDYRDEAATYADNAGISAAGAHNSATLAGQSEVGAEDWYNKSKELYDDLKEGQVYRGTWNPTTNAYPPKPDTNSAWDVSLPSGTASHMFDGKEWRSGDRLLFAVATDMFEQLAVGGGVDSVNGKTGAVTLVASDVGALPTTGGTLTGPLYWLDTKQYINSANKHIYIAAKEGRVYLEGSSTPAVRIGNTDSFIYHQGFKPTVADIGALGNSGTQTLNGTLNAVKFVASDTYGFVSGTRAYQGMYMGKTASDRRTIIGGGGDAVGDGLGTVIIRPNGITDVAGNVIFGADGTITATADGTASTHLVRKGYVDTQVKAVSDKVDAIGPDAINAMPKSGGDFTGPFGVKAATKSAMKVEDGASIRYNDGGGTWVHNFMQGNNLMWNHGTTGENNIMQLGSDGTVVSQGPQYARVGHISQNRAGTNWMALETPENDAPYISSKTPAESGPVVAMRFGQTEVSIESGKRMSSGQFRVAQDGGLKFAPTNDISGTTWAMGINNSTRILGINQYSNGSYQSTPFKIEPTGITHLTGLNVSAGTALSQYVSVTGGGNNVLEFHQPGISAVMVYKPQNSPALRIAQSNGAGGEASMYASIDGDTAYFRGRPTTMWGQGRTWGQSGLSRFYAENVNLDQGMLGSLVSQWLTIPGIVAYEQGMGFLSDQSGNIGNYGHAFYCQDGGSYLKYWIFRNNGGQQSPSGFRIEGDGRMAGKAYEGYEDNFHWATSSLGTVSDARLKTVLGNTTRSALDIVNQFQFKRFVWNEKAGNVYNERAKKVTEIGLIAQEVEAIDPTLVKTIKVGGDEPHDTKTLDTAGMLALALKAIQEQQAEINELKEKLNEFILK